MKKLKLEKYLNDRFKNKMVSLVGAGISNRPLVSMLIDYGAKVIVRDKKSKDELGEIA